MTFKSNRTKGFALVEVMVAALVLTVGAIGFLKLQTIALKSSRNNFARGQGVELASSQIDFFRQNKFALQRPIADGQDFSDNGRVGNNVIFPPVISVARLSPELTGFRNTVNTDCVTHGTVSSGNFSPRCDDALQAYQRYLLQSKLAETFAPGMAMVCTRFDFIDNQPVVRVDVIWRDNAAYDSNNAPPNLAAFTINDCPTQMQNVVNNTALPNSLQQLQATEKSVTVYGRL